MAELISAHDCQAADLNPIEHAANAIDWRGNGSSQSYQVYRCGSCNDYWGIRHQYDAGTGRDDRSHRFGKDIADVRRHY